MKLKTNLKAGDTTSSSTSTSSTSTAPLDVSTGHATGKRQWKPITF